MVDYATPTGDATVTANFKLFMKRGNTLLGPHYPVDVERY